MGSSCDFQHNTLPREGILPDPPSDFATGLSLTPGHQHQYPMAEPLPAALLQPPPHVSLLKH